MLEETWTVIYARVTRCVKKCCIINTLDGTEDFVMFEGHEIFYFTVGMIVGDYRIL
jgi:hypothetical protein